MQDDAIKPEDLTPDQDDIDWGAANEEFAQEKGIKLGDPVEKKKEEDADKGGEPDAAAKKVADEAEAKRVADEAEAVKAKDETPEQTKARHEADAKAAKDKADAEAANQPIPQPVRDARALQRELVEAERVMKDDIRKEMFSDLQTELLDADGDPIRTIEDVQKLENPNTKKPFTEEEAASYLLQAQQHLNKSIKETEAKIEKIAAVNLDLGDKADNVKARFGAVLKSMPDVAKRIVTAFNKTLVTDPKTGTIVDAPVDMEEFFSVALEPYAKAAEDSGKQTQLAEQKKKDEAEANKKKTRQDRSDIYGGGKTETMDAEEKEWANVAKDYYGK